jgi:parallel beta-helix repeat protein
MFANLYESMGRALAAVLVLSSISCVVASVSGSEAEAQWTQHDRISILGDAQFTAEKGVTSGSGISADPYIIEDWQIGPNEDVNSITIKNTAAYFIIRNVNVLASSIGINLGNVTHGRIEDSRVVNSSIGVLFYKCSACKVTSSTFEGNEVAITFSFSDASQSDNAFIDNQENVSVLEHEVPWLQTWVGTAVCIAILIPLVIILGLLIYVRVMGRQPKP